MGVLGAVFWTSAALLAYTYVGYPALAWLRARVRPRAYGTGPATPRVSVLLVAHDEGARIAARLRNLLELDYPRALVEILVGSDGSGDDTVARARPFEARGVRVLEFPTRRGKAAVLNDLALAAGGEILVMADARQVFEPGVLRALVAPFADPAVGAVGGELILVQDPDEACVGAGVGLYWRYEKAIRAWESRADSTVGATGAVYAIRRELFRPLPADTLLDDVVIPLRAVRRGYRVLFEPRARAFDRAPLTAVEELTRKVRTIAGTFQLFARERWLLDPFRNRLWWQTVSHKGLRLAGPLLLLAALASSAALAPASPLHLAALAAQVGFYALAASGSARARKGRAHRIRSAAYAFCLLNWATVRAFGRFLGGRQAGAWEKASPAGLTVPSRSRRP